VGCCTELVLEFVLCLERRYEADVPLHVPFMLVSGGLECCVLWGYLTVCSYGAAFFFLRNHGGLPSTGFLLKAMK